MTAPIEQRSPDIDSVKKRLYDTKVEMTVGEMLALEAKMRAEVASDCKRKRVPPEGQGQRTDYRHPDSDEGKEEPLLRNTEGRTMYPKSILRRRHHLIVRSKHTVDQRSLNQSNINKSHEWIVMY